jgi:hypothetical protein
MSTIKIKQRINYLQMKKGADEKAMQWNFDFNLISENDKETILRAFHGNNWYESASKENVVTNEAIYFTELNALIANGLIKTDNAEYVGHTTKEKRITREVYTHKSLIISDEIVNYYFMRGDGQSEADIVDADTKSQIHEILLKYRFW